VRRALRRARAARALGPGLGPHLQEVHGGRRLQLVFQGSGWEAPLRACEDDLRDRLAQALGHPVDSVEVVGSGVETEPPEERRAGSHDHAGGRAAEAGDLTERLRRIGKALAARRKDADPSNTDIR
jgi:hypothetical protein